jgi:glucose-6-phosphate isomerase
VGSSVNKVVRKSNFMVDIILNFNKAAFSNNSHTSEEPAKAFETFVEKLRALFEEEFTSTGYFISSTQLYRTCSQSPDKAPVYTVDKDIKGPFCAQIRVTNTYD